MILKQNLALCLMILFMAIVSAPTIILSIDDSVDTTILYGCNEEEELEDFELLFEMTSIITLDTFTTKFDGTRDAYSQKNYLQPHLNLVLPPPEFLSV
ncbi:MAG: hypothetical protein Wins2KO_18800 [Winogradskyella sp.]